MAVKRGGLGKGLDSLIPDHKTSKNKLKKKKPEVERKKRKANSLLILIK